MLERRYRGRGRPRSKKAVADGGTPELQHHRDQQIKRLPLHNLDSHLSQAFLSGSHLHAIYALGWIVEDVFTSAHSYTRLLHRAHKSMALPLRLKSSLVPLEERGQSGQICDRRAEVLWQKISRRLDVDLTQAQRCHFFHLFFMNDAALWYQKRQTVSVLSVLHEVMQAYTSS